MARGGLIDPNGACVAVIFAASGLNTQYEQMNGQWYQFVPDNFCCIGDHWSGTAWLYQSSVPPQLTQRQVILAFADAGYAAAMTSAIAGATTANRNAWQPPNVTASDAVVTAAQTSAGLTAAQVRSILQGAQNYPP